MMRSSVMFSDALIDHQEGVEIVAVENVDQEFQRPRLLGHRSTTRQSLFSTVSGISEGSSIYFRNFFLICLLLITFLVGFFAGIMVMRIWGC